MIRILSGDLLIADVIVSLKGNAPLAALATQYHLVPGGKISLDDAGLAAFSKAVEGHAVTVTPGGSSANMLTTLARLLPQVKVQFLGVAGQGAYSGIIADSLADAGVELVAQEGGQAAVSFVLVSEDGQCTIATHPGNARAILKPDVISEAMVAACDIVLVQGSLWHKLEAGFSDRLVALAKKFHRTLWLTLPTQAELTPHACAHFQSLLPQADMLLGNEAELSRLFGGDAMHQLQSALRGTGFITFGKEGAAIVTPQAVEHVPPERIREADIVNTLGAGDTSYAGFVAGMVCGLSAHDAAHIAMTLAGEKLRINSPRLSDPLKSLYGAAQELAVKLGHN